MEQLYSHINSQIRSLGENSRNIYTSTYGLTYNSSQHSSVLTKDSVKESRRKRFENEINALWQKFDTFDIPLGHRSFVRALVQYFAYGVNSTDINAKKKKR